MADVIMKKDLIEVLKKVFHEQDGRFLFAYLFGSRAGETFSESSDTDIAVYTNNRGNKDYFDIKTDLYLRLSRDLRQNDIDIVIMNQCTNILLLNQIITHGQVLYDKNESDRIDYELKILHRAIDFKTQRKMAMGV